MPGPLAGERQADALVGLDAHDQPVGARLRRRHARRAPPSSRKRCIGGRLKRTRDLRHLRGEALARAQQERHAGPAPVVDLGAQRDVGLGGRLGLDALLLPVAVHDLAVALADAVLAAHRVGGHLLAASSAPARAAPSPSRRAPTAPRAPTAAPSRSGRGAAACGSAPCRASTPAVS